MASIKSNSLLNESLLRLRQRKAVIKSLPGPCSFTSVQRSKASSDMKIPFLPVTLTPEIRAKPVKKLSDLKKPRPKKKSSFYNLSVEGLDEDEDEDEDEDDLVNELILLSQEEFERKRIKFTKEQRDMGRPKLSSSG